MVAVSGTPQGFSLTAAGSGTPITYTGGGTTGADVWDVLFVNSDTVVSTPSGWTVEHSRVNGQGSYIFSKAGGTTTATVTTSGNFPCQVIWVRVNGSSGVDTGATSSAGVDGVTAVTTPALTTPALAQSGELALAFAAIHSAGTATPSAYTWSSGYTGLITNASGAGSNQGSFGAIATKPSAGTAAETPNVTWTSSASDRYILFIAFKAGSSTTPFTRDYASTWRVFNGLTRDYASTWRSFVTLTADYSSTWRVTNALTRDYVSTWRVTNALTADYSNIYRVLNAFAARDFASTWRVLNAFATQDYASTWRSVNAFARDYLSTWDVLSGTSFVRDYPSTWRVFNGFSADYLSTYRVLGTFSRDYASTWRILNGFTRDYGSTWRVFRAFTRDYTSTWVVLAETPDGLSVQVWTGTQLVPATLSIWNGTAEVAATIESIAP